jgi:hypothetical protein
MMFESDLDLIRKFADGKDQIIAEVSDWTKQQCLEFLQSHGCSNDKGVARFNLEGEQNHTLTLGQMRNMIVLIRTQLAFPLGGFSTPS